MYQTTTTRTSKKKSNWMDVDHLLELLEEALDETDQQQLASAHNNLNKRIKKCIVRRGGRFENYIFNPAQKARMDAM